MDQPQTQDHHQLPSNVERAASPHRTPSAQSAEQAEQPDAVAPDRTAERLRCAHKCVDQALSQPNPFSASLGSMTGNMMLLGAKLQAAIHDKLGDSPSLEEFRDLAGSLELDLKVCRQIERQVQLLWRESRRQEN